MRRVLPTNYTHNHYHAHPAPSQRKACVVAFVSRNEFWRKAMVLLWWEVCCNGELRLEGGAFLTVAPELHINRIFGNGEVIFAAAR